MGIDPEARRRWREGMVGSVPIRSVRGVFALVLLGTAILLALANPIILGIAALRGEDAGTQEITVELLIVNFAFNLVVLVLLPVAGLAVARPNQPGEVRRRLGLDVDRRTPLWVLLGIGTAILSIFALGLVIWALTQAGLEAEQSPLIDEIDALLTWPLVLLIPLVAALTEEIFFRGILQPRIGLIASSVFFGLVHIGYGTWLQVVAPIPLGFLFGILFQRTKSLWAPIAAHYTFDFVQLLALMLAK